MARRRRPVATINPPPGSINPLKPKPPTGLRTGKPISFAGDVRTVRVRGVPSHPAKPPPSAVPRALRPLKPVAKPVGPAPSPGARALPPDALYESDVAAAQQQRATTLAGLTASRQQELAGMGYTESTAGTLAFNPNDPFSKAALLKKSYDASRARTAQSMGSSGGLYSGAYQQAQDIGNREQLQGEDALQRSLFGWLAQNTGSRTQAGVSEQLALDKAAGARIGRLDTNPLYSPEAAGTLKPPAKKSKPGKPKSGKPKGVAVTRRVGPWRGPGVKFGSPTKKKTRPGPKRGRGVTFT